MSSTSDTHRRIQRARSSHQAGRPSAPTRSLPSASSQLVAVITQSITRRLRLAQVGYWRRTYRSDPAAAPSLFWLARIAVPLELCLLGLLAVAPLGGLSQSVSPLARAWPWLLVPAHYLFPNAPLHISTRPEHVDNFWPATVFACLLLVGSVIVGGALVRCLRQQGAGRRHLLFALGAAAVFGVTLALLPSMPSDDIFSYAIYGRIAVLHHANPLVAVPANFPQDPFLTFVYWRNVRSVYGPIWLLASNAVTLLAQALGGALATYILLFKLLGLVCHLINMVLVWSILTIIAPRRRLLGTLLYGWSPLCLLEFGASGHNDALMLTFLLAALLLLVRGWEIPALLVFGLAIATKYVPIALLPFYLFVIARQAMDRARLRSPAADSAHGAAAAARAGSVERSWWRDRRLLIVGGRAVAWRAAIIFGVVLAFTLPFWSGPTTLKSVLYSPPAERLDNSLLEAISQPLHMLVQALFGLDVTTAQIGVDSVLKVIALLAFVALWLFEFRRARDLAGALDACGWALLWYVLVASGWFWPWYVTWLVAVVALLPWSELTVTTLLLSSGVLILYAFRPADSAVLYGWRALFEFGPAVIYLGWHVYKRRHPSAVQRSHSGSVLAATRVGFLARLRG